MQTPGSKGILTLAIVLALCAVVGSLAPRLTGSENREATPDPTPRGLERSELSVNGIRLGMTPEEVAALASGCK